jgi:hypothetical protein
MMTPHRAPMVRRHPVRGRYLSSGYAAVDFNQLLNRAATPNVCSAGTYCQQHPRLQRRPAIQ